MELYSCCASSLDRYALSQRARGHGHGARALWRPALPPSPQRTTAASSFAPSLFFASPRSPYAIFFSFLFSFLSVFFFILRLRAASSVTCLPRPMLLYLSSSFSFSLLLILKYQPLHKHKLHDKGHHAGVQYCDCISGVCTPLEMGGGNVCGSSSNSRCVCHVEQKPSMPSPGTKLIAVLP